jgi:hypothetical protein
MSGPDGGRTSMGPRWMSIAGALATLAACGDPQPPGHLWHLKVTGATDTCHDPAVDYSGPKEFDYLLRFQGAQVSLSIDDEAFAKGQIAGCSIVYESVVWGEKRGDNDEYEIRWQITGDAQYRAGGTTCNLAAGLDWFGTETYEIIASDDPDIEAGCTYQLDMEGVYKGQQK